MIRTVEPIDIILLLEKEIQQFEWNYDVDDNIMGFAKDSTKTIFISGELSEDQEESFRYCFCGNSDIMFSGNNIIEDLLVRRFDSPEFIKYIIENKI